MGNGYTKLAGCFSGDHRGRRRASAVSWEPYDEGLGHSFAYLRPDSSDASAVAGEETTTFRSISGAAVSANVSTALSTALLSDPDVVPPPSSAGFESSTSFSSVPLQPVPRFSGPVAVSGDRGFMSGPIERSFMSGPLDHRAALFSGPLDHPKPSSHSAQLLRTLSHGLRRPRPRSILRGLARAISGRASAPELKDAAFGAGSGHRSAGELRDGVWLDAPESLDSGLQWAQGKAGEDRVHVVVSEEHGWVFVGIYDGFNGPDATDYLLHNLYEAVHRELKGLLWDDKGDSFGVPVDDLASPEAPDESPVVSELSCREGSQALNKRRRRRGSAKIGNWEKKKVPEIDRRLKEESNRRGLEASASHLQVLKALCRALKKTEDTYFDIADKMVSENPELALMGSCLLVMLMKGDDVYLMNVGDSRAILARQMDSDVWRKVRHDLKRINEEAANDVEIKDPFLGLSNLDALQLTLDHSTSVEEEIRRIRKEHPDDSSAIANARVKGVLKVTRAFGAGFLKQPKWNDVLLEMFRINYVGSSPYLTCNPFLYHHKLGPKDKFLILSSDGLYQYMTNEEAVAQVEIFMSITPEGDPAQHLVEEVLFRAAKRAGMDFHELLEVPQGHRRSYHDDISIIIISLEGRIWRSCL